MTGTATRARLLLESKQLSYDLKFAAAKYNFDNMELTINFNLLRGIGWPCGFLTQRTDQAHKILKTGTLEIQSFHVDLAEVFAF